MKKLFEHQDSKLKEALRKAEKRKGRDEKRAVRTAEKMKKQRVKDEALEVEKPLIRLLVDGGFQSATNGKPTVASLEAIRTEAEDECERRTSCGHCDVARCGQYCPCRSVVGEGGRGACGGEIRVRTRWICIRSE